MPIDNIYWIDRNIIEFWSVFFDDRKLGSLRRRSNWEVECAARPMWLLTELLTLCSSDAVAVRLFQLQSTNGFCRSGLHLAHICEPESFRIDRLSCLAQSVERLSLAFLRWEPRASRPETEKLAVGNQAHLPAICTPLTLNTPIGPFFGLNWPKKFDLLDYCSRWWVRVIWPY